MNSVMLIDVPTDMCLPADCPIRRKEATATMRSVVHDAAKGVFGDGDGLLGLFVRRQPKANGAWARAFDYDHSVALALLVCAGFEARAAAALINMDIACVVGPEGSSFLTKKQTRDFVPALAGQDAHGKPYAVLFRTDYRNLDPAHIQQPEGYFVLGIDAGKVSHSNPLLHAIKMATPCALGEIELAWPKN